MITVTLSSAACCLLSLDDSGMLRERQLEYVGSTRGTTTLRGERSAIESLRDDFGGEALDGFAAFDNPGACKRAARGAIRAIDAALAKQS